MSVLCPILLAANVSGINVIVNNASSDLRLQICIDRLSKICLVTVNHLTVSHRR